MLTDEQKQAIADEVKTTVDQAYESAIAEKSKEISKRFEPKGDEMDVKVINNPEDKLISDPKGGFKSFGHFLKELIDVEDKTNPRAPDALSKWVDVLRKTAGTMEEGIPSQGGYTVPVEFGQAILDKALEESIVRPRAQFQPMASNRIEIVADVDNNHSANYFGGVLIYHTSESGQMTASNPKYDRIALTLHKITGLCHITNELIEDSSIAVEADVKRKFGMAMGFVMDDDFLNGSGASEPLGMLDSANPALITVTAVAGQGANTVIAENVRDMWSRMYGRGKNRAIWLANHDVFPQLFGMVLTVGTGGVPIWMPAGGVSQAPYESLMGKPLIYTEKCRTLGTAGDIALVDIGSYIVAGKANSEAPNVATTIHLRFDYDEQSFRFTMRYDGQPLWTAPLTPLYSTTTLSPFVVLSSTRT